MVVRLCDEETRDGAPTGLGVTAPNGASLLSTRVEHAATRRVFHAPLPTLTAAAIFEAAAREGRRQDDDDSDDSCV